MASSGQRNFSFQHSDDDPHYHPLTAQKPMATQHEEYHDPSWQHQQHQNQQYDSYQSPQQYQQPPLERQASTSTIGSFAARDDLSNTVGNRNSGTVIRKTVAPAAAASAAAALATVRNDLAPPVPSHGPGDRGYNPPPPGSHDNNAYFGGDAGYDSRGAGNSPGSLQYPPTAGTPHSHAPLLAAPPTMPGWPERQSGSSERVYQDPVAGHYTDNPYQRSSTLWDPALQQTAIDGSAELVVSDDEDDYGRRHKKGAAAAAAAGGAYPLAAGGGKLRGGAVEGGGLLRKSPDGKAEKSLFTAKEARTNTKKRWLLWILGIFVVLAIAGGTTAGVLVSKNKADNDGKATKSDNTAAGGGGINIDAQEDFELNGDLDKNSKEIKELMDNPDLHKVFHGIDYTPLNGVYPECIKWVPSQNNITRDIAVMSLLTDKIRLYGNDCNQTEMVFHAIDRLGVDMKVWVGVWLDGNTTTNDRQLHQLWDIVDLKEHHDKIEGIAVGNEVLFSKYLTELELTTIIEEVRSNLTERSYVIPVGTSDLGSNWNADMASKVDVLMANVHPFFAGVTADKAAAWTYKFFEENDVAYTLDLAKPPRVMISEVGWPSGGGKEKGSVAGIDEFNVFMEDFVCTENKRGTEYFWFSAFDEPWKMKYNEPELGKEWEDKWGLMDVNRVLKDGLKIPTCKPSKK